MIDQYKDFLLKSQQLNGSFGYRKQAGNIVEATVYSLLALNTLNPRLAEIQAGVKWLLTMQNKDGGWFLFDEDDNSSPYVTALALIALYRINKTLYSAYIEKGLKYLENVHYFFSNKDLNPYVWGWNKGCFVGPEPTGDVLLALKMLKSKNDVRIREAESFFDKLRCFEGGWTYNLPVDRNDVDSKTPCQVPLAPELNVTAVVLLSVQDKKDKYFNHINVLLKKYDKSYCPFALSLSVLALDCYKQETSNVLERLNKIMATDDFVKVNVVYNAIALLANLTIEGKNPLCLRS